jgi:uncharacterized surface protein with fasciclin (FAS1) repeats
MKRMTTVLTLVLVLALLSATLVSAQRFKPGDDTIATIAVENGNFTTLVEALTCTGLVGAVADPDAELTVFAPTDTAFDNIGLNAGNICDLDTGTLTTVLLYHVTEDRRPSPSVINGRNKSIDMLAGGSIFPQGQRSTRINDNSGQTINIILPDVLASNGIIHVIDTVMFP